MATSTPAQKAAAARKLAATKAAAEAKRQRQFMAGDSTYLNDLRRIAKAQSDVNSAYTSTTDIANQDNTLQQADWQKGYDRAQQSLKDSFGRRGLWTAPGSGGGGSSLYVDQQAKYNTDAYAQQNSLLAAIQRRKDAALAAQSSSNDQIGLNTVGAKDNAMARYRAKYGIG